MVSLGVIQIDIRHSFRIGERDAERARTAQRLVRNDRLQLAEAGPGDDLERHLNELIFSYRTYLAENPDDLSALILYGKLLRRIGKNDEAFKAFLRADELDPQIAVVKQQIGNHLAETGKGKAALTFTLNAITLEPEVPAYHYALGEILYTFREPFIQQAVFSFSCYLALAK